MKLNPSISLNNIRAAFGNQETGLSSSQQTKIDSQQKQIDQFKRTNENLTQQLLEAENLSNSLKISLEKTKEELSKAKLEQANIPVSFQEPSLKTKGLPSNFLLESLFNLVKKYELSESTSHHEEELITLVDNGFFDLQSKLSDTIGISEDLSNKIDHIRSAKEQSDTDAEKTLQLLGRIDSVLNTLTRGDVISITNEEVKETKILDSLLKISDLIEDLKSERESSLNIVGETRELLSKVEAELAHTKMQLSEQNKFNLDKESDLVVAVKRVQELEKIISSLKVKQSQTEEEFESVMKLNNQSIEQAEHDLINLKTDLLNREKEIEAREEAFNNAIDEFNQKQEEFRQQEEEFYSRSNDFAQEVEAKQNELNSYSEELERIKLSLDEREQDLEGRIQEINQDRNDIVEEVAALQQLKEELENQRIEIEETRANFDETIQSLMADEKIKKRLEARLNGEEYQGSQDEGGQENIQVDGGVDLKDGSQNNDGSDEVLIDDVQNHDNQGIEVNFDPVIKTGQNLAQSDEAKNQELDEESALKALDDLPSGVKNFIESRFVEQEDELKRVVEENELLSNQLQELAQNQDQEGIPTQEEIKELLDQLQKLNDENIALKNELEQSQFNLNQTTESSNQQLTQLTATLQEWVDECETRGHVIQQREEENEASIKKVDELQEALQSLQDRNLELQNELNEIKVNKLGEFNQEDKQQIIEEFEQLQGENQELKQVIQEMEKERLEKEEGIKGLIEQYEEQLSEMQNENQTLAEALNQVKPETFQNDGEQQDQNQQLLEAAGFELEELRKENEQLKVDKDELLMVIENIENEGQADNEEDEELLKRQNEKKTSVTLKRENEELSEVLKAAAEEIHSLRLRYSELIKGLGRQKSQDTLEETIILLLEADLPDPKELNSNLWALVHQIRIEKQRLLGRISRVEIWSRDKDWGIPESRENDENSEEGNINAQDSKVKKSNKSKLIL